MAVTRDAPARLVGVAGAALIASSLVGGAASVLAGENTWANAWSAEATLAAPWPMLLLLDGRDLSPRSAHSASRPSWVRVCSVCRRPWPGSPASSTANSAAPI